MEDLAYRRLLDFYYLHEKPIDAQTVARHIGMRDHQQEVEQILNEFFVQTPDGFISERADREIASYRKQSDGGKLGAAIRWGKGTDSPPIAPLSPAHDNPNSNHKPITNNHKPVIKDKALATRLPNDWQPDHAYLSFCRTERPDLDPHKVADSFRDYWISAPGAKGKKQDWMATWRNWVRNQRQERPQTLNFMDDRKNTLDQLTGRNRHGHTTEIDITAESTRITRIVD